MFFDETWLYKIIWGQTQAQISASGIVEANCSTTTSGTSTTWPSSTTIFSRTTSRTSTGTTRTSTTWPSSASRRTTWPFPISRTATSMAPPRSGYSGIIVSWTASVWCTNGTNVFSVQSTGILGAFSGGTRSCRDSCLFVKKDAWEYWSNGLSTWNISESTHKNRCLVNSIWLRVQKRVFV